MAGATGLSGEPNHTIIILRLVQQRIRLFFPALLAALLMIFTACEDPGSVGSGFLDDDAGLETSTLRLGTAEPENALAYSGRLRFMAIGQYDDPLFGRFRSVGILKPSIDTTSIGSIIAPDDQFQLRIPISATQYGDTTTTAHFEIYRLSDIWRGNELYFTDELQVDQSRLVGEFSLSRSETVLVDLAEDWIEEFNEYLSDTSSTRAERYRNEFPGLAIVPAEENTRVFFARMQPDAGNEPNPETLVRFVRIAAEDLEDDGDNGEDGDEDDPRQFQALNDWGTFGERSGPDEGQTDEQSYYINNTLDPVLRFETGLSEGVPGSRNVANAQLVFYLNRDLLESSLPSGHVRPPVDQLRIHRVNADRVGEWIFGREPLFVATLNQSSDSFRFDITDYINEILFDNTPPGTFYLSAQAINGLVFSTLLHADNAVEALRPKILITSVNSDNR